MIFRSKSTVIYPAEIIDDRLVYNNTEMFSRLINEAAKCAISADIYYQLLKADMYASTFSALEPKRFMILFDKLGVYGDEELFSGKEFTAIFSIDMESEQVIFTELEVYNP